MRSWNIQEYTGIYRNITQLAICLHTMKSHAEIAIRDVPDPPGLLSSPVAF
jgi:hypothetical protein